MYLVVHNNNRERQSEGYAPVGSIISRHRTLRRAQEEYRRRNPHLFNRRWAEAHGYASTGTFDEIVEVGKDGCVIRECSTREDTWED